MTAPSMRSEVPVTAAGEPFGLLLLRNWKGLIVGLGAIGFIAGAAVGLLTPRRYISSATFIPQTTDASLSGLALAARQFGIQVPNTGGGWGPAVYVELMRSQAVLEPIALDTLTVVEDGNRRVAVMDLLDVPALSGGQRSELAVKKLNRVIATAEEKRLNGVRLSVTTKWPSVSLAIAEALVSGVNRFNLESRKSQASAERIFVEAQAGEAQRLLLEVEQRLQAFLRQNRSIVGSPDLTFAQERLQREVSIRQQVYTTLVQSREEARIREVRDTPVFTVLEAPRLAATGEPRKTAMKAVLGGFAGVLLALALAFVREAMLDARRTGAGPLRSFLQLLN